MPPQLLGGFACAALADALAALGADAWLLYDFRHVNPVAERILGPTGMGTRRLFVLLPRSGKPVAVAHRIELQPLADFPGEVCPYGSWRELHDELRALARGRTLAMEVSPQDAVPYLDRVPHGVVQLLEGFGARVVSSAPLVSRFAARWSAAEAAGHRRAAQALAEIAREALTWAGRETGRGAEVREVTLQQRVVEAIGRAGLVTDHPPIALLTRRCARSGIRCGRRVMPRSPYSGSAGRGRGAGKGHGSPPVRRWTMRRAPWSAGPGTASISCTAPDTRLIVTCTARARTSTTSRPPTNARSCPASASLWSRGCTCLAGSACAARSTCSWTKRVPRSPPRRRKRSCCWCEGFLGAPASWRLATGWGGRAWQGVLRVSPARAMFARQDESTLSAPEDTPRSRSDSRVRRAPRLDAVFVRVRCSAPDHGLTALTPPWRGWRVLDVYVPSSPC